MTDVILLTGATGFLGTEIASRLAAFPEVKVYALVRASDDEEAYGRLKEAWYHDRELYRVVGSRVVPVAGDFTREDLSLNTERKEMLKKETTLVIHAGAEIGFQKSRDELMSANVAGTQQILAFAGGMKKLRRFVHISTAYVSGQRRGSIKEEDIASSGFSGFYEESKARAEELVRASGLPFSICRPGMIVGDSQNGWIRNFNTIYYILKLMLLGKLPYLPVSREMRLNIVPGDYVADAVVTVAFKAEAEGRTFHLTCPREDAPKAGDILELVVSWARENLAVRLRKPLFLPLPVLKTAGLAYNKKKAGRKKGYWTNLLTLLPYFFGDQDFDRTNTDSIVGPFDRDWRAYLPKLLSFACRKNFMRQTGRSVFRQAEARRESRRYPVFYYDV